MQIEYVQASSHSNAENKLVSVENDLANNCRRLLLEKPLQFPFATRLAGGQYKPMDQFRPVTLRHFGCPHLHNRKHDPYRYAAV